MNEKYLDKDIYKKAKKIVDKKHKKHSAYKSMDLVKTYKDMGGRIDDSKAKKKGTTKWLKEKWKNLTGVAQGKMSIADAPKCGNKYTDQGSNPSICRPTVKVDSKTPVLAQSYSKSQLKKALDLKKKGKTISWKNL